MLEARVLVARFGGTLFSSWWRLVWRFDDFLVAFHNPLAFGTATFDDFMTSEGSSRSGWTSFSQLGCFLSSCIGPFLALASATCFCLHFFLLDWMADDTLATAALRDLQIQVGQTEQNRTKHDTRTRYVITFTRAFSMMHAYMYCVGL